MSTSNKKICLPYVLAMTVAAIIAISPNSLCLNSSHALAQDQVPNDAVAGEQLAGPIYIDNINNPANPGYNPAISPVLPSTTLPVTNIVQTQANVTTTEPFNGKTLYEKAFEAIRDRHIMLADEKAREKFVKEWEHKYDQGTQLDTEEGADKAIREMLASQKQRFDTYLDVKDTEQEANIINPNLVGIGAALEIEGRDEIIKTLPKGSTVADLEKALVASLDHPVIVRETLEESPAEKHLLAGDRITQVNGISVDGKTLKDIISDIKGAENTNVKIKVERTDDKGNKSEHTFDITRKKVVLRVVHFKDCGDDIAYIGLDNFMSDNTLPEMARALTVAAKGKAVIIDLRGNGGGRLDYVLTMASFFLPEGTLLETRNREGNRIIENQIILLKDILLNTTNTGVKKKNAAFGNRSKMIIPEDMPVIVLVDGSSASASEILSGVLQKHHRGLIMGTEPTLGKGVGQNVIELPFNRSMHITSFEFMPGGETMDWIGIIPDIDVDQPKGAKDDKLLDDAITKAKELVTAQEKLKQRRVDLKKANEANFQKYLDFLANPNKTATP
jgi:carboxyl-terminal processing protease